jgi:hypothetical protein
MVYVFEWLDDWMAGRVALKELMMFIFYYLNSPCFDNSNYYNHKSLLS